MATAYQVKKKTIGGYSVSYGCPHCSAPLVSSLKEAGSSQPCPECQRPFVVPGKAEAEELARRTALAAKQKQQAEVAAVAAKKLADERAAEQQQTANKEAAEKARVDYLEQQKQLYFHRGYVALQPRSRNSYSFSLHVVTIFLALNAILSALGAIVCALTVIGLPIAVGLAINFVLTIAVHEVIIMIEEIRYNTAEALKHQEYHSSVLQAMYMGQKKE